MLRKKNLKGQLTVGILLIILISSIGSATQLSNNNISINDELFSIPHSSRKTIYVDDNNTEGPWDGTIEHPYQFVQDGVDNATSGDTVFVFNGTYPKKIVVPNQKEINIIGEDRNITKIKGTITVYADNLNFSGFTTNYIDFDCAHYCSIYGNKILDGLRIWSSKHVTIRNNNISNSDYCGIFVDNVKSENILIIDNIIEGNRRWNILLDGSSHKVIGNILRLSDETGFSAFCDNSLIKNNTITFNGYGVCIFGNNNIFINNDISNNYGNGISIIGDDNIICGNNINDNTGHCIKIEIPEIPWDWTTKNNIIYQNNFINNTAYHKYPEEFKWNFINFWYKPILKKGNYWSDYTGTDNDGDGIGDIPYEIPPSGRSKDRFPLIEPVDIDDVVVIDIERVFAEYKIEIPRNRLLTSPLFMRLLERFPSLEKFLTLLIK